MITRMLLPLNLQLFSADGANGGMGSGLTPEQLDGMTLEIDDTYQTDLSGDESGQIDSGSQTTGNVGENIPAPSTHKIKWNGEERELSYEDLINHAQQGFDYTQKTQSLKEQQRQFEEQFAPYRELDTLFSSNPQLEQQFTEMLNNHFNSQNGQAPTQPNQQTPGNQVPDISSHPMVRQMQEQIQQQQAFMQQWQEQQRLEQVGQEWNSLVNQFPDAKDQEEQLYQFAIDNNMNLENAYKLMNWGNIQKQTEQKMVENNMKKKVAQTLRPNNNVANKSAKPSKPDGMNVYDWLKTQDLNLME